jgi:hypothetical protein
MKTLSQIKTMGLKGMHYQNLQTTFPPLGVRTIEKSQNHGVLES